MQTEPNVMARIATRFVNTTNRHVFLTGKAGTGKTTLLRAIVRSTHKNAVVAAPTGIAAINAEGVTLHSLFQLPFGAFIPSNQHLAEAPQVALNTPQTLMQSFKMNRHKRKLLRALELLIIDEVSMLRADILDAIDVVLRAVRRRGALAFGGVQVLFIGDLLQLPPVVKAGERAYLDPFYPDAFFFNAKVLADNPPLYIELDKIYRQRDSRFITLLNHLREDKVDDADLALLNDRYIPSFKPDESEGYVFLTTHNRKADAINQSSLKVLGGKSFFFEARIEGDFGEHLYPVDERLELKKGAQVMFIKNDYSGEGRYFNGKIGKISKLTPDEIRVVFADDGAETLVERHEWENKKYTLNKETQQIEEKVVGTFSHYPLKPAWAITVHKSQGLTFDKAVIDVSGAFAPGQIYVALSRLTSLEGLVLSAPIPARMPKTNPALLEFSDRKQNLGDLEGELENQAHRFVRETALGAFDFGELVRQAERHTLSYDKDESRSIKQAHQDWAGRLLEDTRPLVSVAEKFQGELAGIFQSGRDDYLVTLHRRLKAAKGYFEPLLRDLSNRIKTHILDLGGQKRVKAYITELKDLESQFFRQIQLIYKAEALAAGVLNQTDVSGETLKKSGLYQDRDKTAGAKAKKPSKAGAKGDSDKKAPTPDTKAVSLEMLEAGQDIADIAASRGLKTSTIEGHLAHFVAQGKLDVGRFLSPSQLAEISKQAQKMEDGRLRPLKEALKDKYTYGELKMALAHFERQALTPTR